MTTVRIATRGSDLALVQARIVAALIARELGAATEIVPLKTTGDRIQNVSLAKIGGKGLFVKEIEEALLDGRADLAVHSAKDLPATLADGLELVAFPERVDCRDALVSRERGVTVAALRPGARVGTGSARRAAQLRNKRPDVEIVPLRGNVPTRLRALETGDLDAVILACAGLERLGLAERIDERIATDWMLPAVAQGALAIEARSADPLAQAAAALNHRPTERCIRAERAFLLGVGGDCTVPLAALAQPSAAGLRVRALIAATDGSRIVRDEIEVGVESAEAGGAQLAVRVLAAGGDALLDGLRREAEA